MRDASTRLHGPADFSRAAIAAAMLAACALGGCASSGGPAGGAFAMASGGAATVTFESIDGPPPQVFDRMVSVLDTESKLRNLAIVSRESAATYRVRSYLSAQVVRGRTMIAWVWDVYDGSQQRALAPVGRRARRQARPRRLGRRRRHGAAPDRPGRPQRADSMINGAPAGRRGPCPGKRGPAVASAEPVDGSLAYAAH